MIQKIKLNSHHRKILSKHKPVLLKQYNYKCKECGCGEHLTIDHIVPLSKGGHPTSLKNLQILCRNCNVSKGSCFDKSLVFCGIDYNALFDKLKFRLHQRIDNAFPKSDTITSDMLRNLQFKFKPCYK